MKPNGSNNYLAASYEDALKENARLRAELEKAALALHFAWQALSAIHDGDPSADRKKMRDTAGAARNAAYAALAPAASGEKEPK